MVEIDTIVINNRKYAIFLLAFMGGGAIMGLVLGYILTSYPVLILFVIAAFFCPLIFQNRFRYPYTKRAVLKFYDDTFCVILSDRKTGKSEKIITLDFKEVRAFKAAESSKDESSFVKIYLKDGSSVHFSFIVQEKQNESKDVTRVLKESIRNYNMAQIDDNNIEFMPLLLGSRKGKYYITGLTVLLISVIAIQIFFHSKGIPVTLFSGLILYFLILAQRKKDIEQSSKVK